MSDGILIVGGGLAAARGGQELPRGGRHRPDPAAVTSDSAYPYFRPPLSKRYMRGEIDADGHARRGAGVLRRSTTARSSSRRPSPRCATTTSSSTPAISCRSNGSCSRAAPRRGRSRCPAPTSTASTRCERSPTATEIRERAARVRAGARHRPELHRPRDDRFAYAAGRPGHALSSVATSCSRRSPCRPSRGFSTTSTASTASSSSTRTRSPRSRGDAGRIATVKTKGGEEREADLLIAGIGVTPNTAFLDGAG